jgi:cbb3-type cytochrome oxidase maturation protein
MEVIYILLSISLSVSLLFLGIFIYNLYRGQFDDDYTPSIRILFEETGTQKNSNTKEIKKCTQI